MVMVRQVESLRAELRLQGQIEQSTFEQHEAEIDALWARHDEELDALRAQVDERDAEIEALRAEVAWLREQTGAPELRCELALDLAPESEQLEMFGED